MKFYKGIAVLIVRCWITQSLRNDVIHIQTTGIKWLCMTFVYKRWDWGWNRTSRPIFVNHKNNNKKENTYWYSQITIIVNTLQELLLRPVRLLVLTKFMSHLLQSKSANMKCHLASRTLKVRVLVYLVNICLFTNNLVQKSLITLLFCYSPSTSVDDQVDTWSWTRSDDWNTAVPIKCQKRDHCPCPFDYI